jgi:phosphoserine phosphatase RsbU/P
MKDEGLRRRLAARALPPLAVSALLLSGKLIFHSSAPAPALARFGGEILFFVATALWLRAGIAFFGGRRARPLQVLHVALPLVLFVFLLFIVLNGLHSPVPLRSGAFPLAWMLFPLLLSPLLAFLLAAFRTLSTIKQSRVPTRYFTGMLVVFSAAFFLAPLPSLPEVARGFILACAVLAMAFNSFRVKWIAFLTKKQKRNLFGLSSLFLILAILNTIMAFGGGFLIDALSHLAPGLLQVHKLVMLHSALCLGLILATALFHLPTADAYEQKAREASSLMDLSHAITEMADFGELADKVAAITATVCHADHAWLAILEPAGLTVPGVHNIGHEEALEISRIVVAGTQADGIGLRVLHNQKIRVQMHTDVTTFVFRSLVLAPLTVKNRVTGYLFTAVRKEDVLDDVDLLSVRAFASSAAMALENARLLDSRLEKERLLKELEIARDIQHRLLPNGLPHDPHVDLAAYFSPAYEAGGDYYDFCRVAGRHLAFIIADVSGKGISAAFVMAELKGVFTSLATVCDGPRELLTRANDILKESLERSRFISASCGWLDAERRVLHVARAGHMPFFLISQNQARRFTPGGLVLGMKGSETFAEKLEEIRLELRAGDILVFFTDGVSETRNLLGQDFGYDRICAAILARCGETAAQLTEAVVGELKSFANNPVQHDDISLLVFKIT